MTKTISFRVWLIINLIGLIAYYFLGQPLWLGPEDESGPGDGLYFGLIILPIILLAVLINFVALVWILIERKRQGFKQAIFYWVIVVILWVINDSIFTAHIQGRHAR